MHNGVFFSCNKVAAHISVEFRFYAKIVIFLPITARKVVVFTLFYSFFVPMGCGCGVCG